MKPHLAYRLLLSLALFTAASTHAQDANQNYEKAVAAYQDSEYKEAYIHLKNTLQEDPNNLSARLLLAQLHFNEGDIYSAEKEYDQALLLGADINLILPLYGTSLVLQQKVDKLFEMEKVYSSFTSANQFEWALLKGQGYFIKQEPALARAEFEKAAAMFPADVRVHNTLAAIYLSKGKFDEALGFIDESLALEPDNQKTWLLRGELAASQEDYNQALRHFSKAYDLASDDPKILRSMARIHLLLGNQAEMQHYLDLILQQSPQDPAATLLSAILLMGQGDAELGDEMLTNLSNKLSQLDETKLQSGDSFLFIRASADYVRGNDDSAITLLNSYLSRNKADLAAIRMLADLYLRNGELTQATQLLANSKTYISADFGLTLQLLNLYIRSNNRFGAQELLEDVKRVAKDNPYVIMLEAEYLRASGQPESALALLNGRDYAEREPLAYGLLRGALELDLGMGLVAQGSARRLQQRFPEDVRVYNFSAVTYLRSDKLEDAETHIHQALQLDPDNIQARFNQAMLLKKMGQPDQSSKILNGILEDHPNHTNSILLMARILYDQGLYQEAIDWSKKVYAYESNASAPGELQLDVYSTLGDWKRALTVALQLSKQNPLNTAYLVRLANVYMELQDFESAQRPLYKLYTLWEDQPTRLRELAALQVKSKNLQAARTSLEKALQMDMRSFPVRLDIARLELIEKNPGGATQIIAKLQAEFGEQSELSYLAGELALARGDLEAAQVKFTEAYELDASNTGAVVQLYQLSIQGIGGDAFTSMLEATLRESSLPPWAVRMLADSYLTQGKTAAAARYYESLLIMPGSKPDPAILNNLANIYALKDLDKALATALEGLNEEGKNSAALLDTIGWILARQEHYEEALPYLREAYAMNSTDPEIRYHLGAILLAMGRNKEAEAELRAAIASGQDFTGTEEAQRLLASMQ